MNASNEGSSASNLASLCSQQPGSFVSLPVQRVEQVVQPNEHQNTRVISPWTFSQVPSSVASPNSRVEEIAAIAFVILKTLLPQCASRRPRLYSTSCLLACLSIIHSRYFAQGGLPQRRGLIRPAAAPRRSQQIASTLLALPILYRESVGPDIGL